jgi:2-keto-4-pentenoate hydratase/2-oxohepta-3-ene-1,7-dioic acid hydratase in catechol pathway
MRLVTYRHAGGDHEHVGALDGQVVYCLTEAGIARSAMEIIRGGERLLDHARAAVPTAPRYALDAITLTAPIRPGKVLCSGINYRSHAEENPDAKMPIEPFFFAKLPSSIIGPNEPIVKPPQTQQLDYEVEFAVVMGRHLHKAAEAEVMPAIFGYTLLHDVSARDVQFKDNQITLGKNFAGFAPIGPCIVTKAQLPDPANVRLRTRLNGVTMQDGTTADWLFPLPRLIAFLSQVMPLEPGDIVTTGTPAGVGVFRKPPVFMNAGDVVEIEADGIGVLRNPIVAG